MRFVVTEGKRMHEHHITTNPTEELVDYYNEYDKK
jgi:hypothetical protein